MKNVKWALLVLLMLTVVIAGCTNGNSGTGTTNGSEPNQGDAVVNGDVEEIELEFWTISLKNAFEPYFNDLIAEYEAQNPHITINWVDVPGDQAESRFLAALTSGDVPDIANIYGIPMFIQEGALVKIDDYMTDEIRNEYFEFTWEGENSFEGEAYGIPWYGSGNVLFYNRDVFERAGLDPDQPPTTYEEQAEFSKIIREQTGVYGFDPIGVRGDSWYEQIVTLNGVVPFNEDFTEARLDHPVIREAIEMWADLYQTGAIPPESINIQVGETDMITRYTEGQTAMLQQGGWIERFFTDPNIFENTAIAPAPVGDHGRSPLTYQYLVVPTQSEHPQEAVDFGLYVTNATNILEFAKQVAILPAAVGAAEDEFFTSDPQTLGDEANQATIELMNADQAFVYTELVPNYRQYQDVFRREVEKVLVGNLSVDEAIANTEARWNQMLQQ